MTLAQAFDAGMAALRRGDRDNAESIFQQVLAAKPDHAPSTHFLGVIGFQRGRHDEGIDLMRRGIAQRPDEAAFHQNLGGALRQIGRDAEALSALQTATRLAPADATAAANLATVFYRLGRHDEALAEGRRTLTLKDEQSRARDIAPIAPEEATVPPFRADQPERNIIAFSLWGDGEEYLTGALENARLVAEIYPGWPARFYVDATVPGTVVQDLEAQAAQIERRPTPKQAARGAFWRFEAANDPDIDRFLCRDCDARLNRREAAAVADWINEGSAFHIMRDSPAHLELILAGMWGGVAGVLPALEPLIAPRLAHYGGRWADQIFLREEIWPLICNISVAHDSVFRFGHARPFPEGAELPRGQHVGGSVLGARDRGSF